MKTKTCLNEYPYFYETSGWEGYADSLDILGVRHNVRIVLTGDVDKKAMRADWNAISGDLRRVMLQVENEKGLIGTLKHFEAEARVSKLIGIKKLISKLVKYNSQADKIADTANKINRLINAPESSYCTKR